MSNGQGGVPGYAQFDWKTPQQTSATPENIFDIIKQSQTETMSEMLPEVSKQLSAAGEQIAPQIEALRQRGEEQAAVAQSEAAARGLRGSDIEAAGVAGARQAAGQQMAQVKGRVAMQQGQIMAEAIMKARGYDIESNKQMFLQLAKAMGEQYSLQTQIDLAEKQLKAYKDAMKERSQAGLLGDVLGGGLTALTFLKGGGG